MRSASRLIPLLLILLALVSLGATLWLAPAQRNTDLGFANNTLFASTNGLPVTRDPAAAALKADVDVLGQVYEGLVRLDPHTLQVVPGQAESWHLSSDGKTYTFQLRAGLRWSDGSPLRATSFVDTAKRVLAPEAKALRQRPWLHLRGANAYRLGQSTDFTKVGLTALSENVLQLDLEHPSETFLSELAGPGGWPTPPEGFSATGPVSQGNGPFLLSTFSEKRVELLRNPYYWAQGLPKLARVVLLPTNDESSLEPLRFDAGQVHICDGIAGWVADRLKHRSELTVAQVWSCFYLRFNTLEPPFDDPRLRLALSLAIDREAIARDRRDPQGFVGWTLIPPLYSGFPHNEILKQRQASARALFESLLRERGGPLPPLTVYFDSGDEPRRAALEVVRAWRQNLGLAANIKPDDGALIERGRSHVLFITGLAGTVLDPVNLLGAFESSRDLSGSGWHNPTFDHLLALSRGGLQGTERLALLARAEELLLTEAPIAPIFYGRSIQMVHARVKGWPSNALDLRSFREVSLQ